jgi:hypothetical protein
MFEKEDMQPKYGFNGRRIGSQCAGCKQRDLERKKLEKLTRLPS